MNSYEMRFIQPGAWLNINTDLFFLGKDDAKEDFVKNPVLIVSRHETIYPSRKPNKPLITLTLEFIDQGGNFLTWYNANGNRFQPYGAVAGKIKSHFYFQANLLEMPQPANSKIPNQQALTNLALKYRNDILEGDPSTEIAFLKLPDEIEAEPLSDSSNS